MVLLLYWTEVHLVQHNSGGIDTSTSTGGTTSVPGRGTAVVTTAEGELLALAEVLVVLLVY